jgi:hypothetical protein
LRILIMSDARVEVDIFRMLVSSRKTIVIYRDSEHQLQTPVILNDSEQYHPQHEDAHPHDRGRSLWKRLRSEFAWKCNPRRATQSP